MKLNVANLRSVREKSRGFTITEIVVTIVLVSLFTSALFQWYQLVETDRLTLSRQSVANDIANINLRKFSILPTSLTDNCSTIADGVNLKIYNNYQDEIKPGYTQTIKGYKVDGCNLMKIESVVTYKVGSANKTIKRVAYVKKDTAISTPVLPPTIEYLVVGGGGGGGDRHGGGGGGGGVLTGTFQASQSSYTLTVGSGGVGGNYEAGSLSPRGIGGNGGNSVIAGIATAYGGGGGGTYDGNSTTGPFGSGGGGGGNNWSGVSPPAVQQGYSGGSGLLPGGGGGGGAGGAGGNANNGSGGVGTPNSITGSSTYYGGGGGGAWSTNTGPSTPGGSGGGGAGSWNAGAVAGSANSGGGGGGARSSDTSSSSGAPGGSGVIILKVPSGYILNFNTGLTYSTDTISVPNYTIYKITATSSVEANNTFTYTPSNTSTPSDTLLTTNTYSQSSVYSYNRAATWQYMNNNDARGEDTYSNSQTGTNVESQPWIKTDLASTRNISYVIVGYDFNGYLPGGWGQSYTTGSTLQGSNDNVTWTDIASLDGNYDTSTGLQRINVNQSWRYLRVTRTNDYLALLEFQVWVGSTTSTPSSSTDPYYSSLVALLNLNGSDISTTITDDSPLKSNWIVDGTAKLTTSQKKFGTAALNLSDGLGYIRASAASSNFIFNSGQDFTIEAWIYPTNANQGIIIDSRWGGYSYYTLAIASGGVLSWAYEATSGNQIGWNSATGAIVANQWQHVAVSRASGTFRMFVNGNQVITAQADTRGYTGVGTQRPTAGTDGNGPYYGPGKFYGYMDGIRITRAGRYTVNFTPPTSDYPTQ